MWRQSEGQERRKLSTDSTLRRSSVSTRFSLEKICLTSVSTVSDSTLSFSPIVALDWLLLPIPRPSRAR